VRDREALLRAFIEEVWNRGDVAAADRFVAARYTLRHDPGDPWDGQTLDLEGFKARVRASRAPCPEQRFALEGCWARDDAVVIAWRWTGVHAGELAGWAPTGRALTMSGLTAYFFDEDDRLTGHWQVVDRLGVLRQLRENADA
jgi:predicted ester cyclase